MAEYRLYFLDGKGAIQARQEFCAPSDAEANFISSIVADACCGEHRGYELWSFARRVVVGRETKPVPSSDEISRHREEQILELEDSIQRSQWRIAQSQRFTEKSDELRRFLGARKAPMNQENS